MHCEAQMIKRFLCGSILFVLAILVFISWAPGYPDPFKIGGKNYFIIGVHNHFLYFGMVKVVANFTDLSITTQPSTFPTVHFYTIDDEHVTYLNTFSIWRYQNVDVGLPQREYRSLVGIHRIGISFLCILMLIVTMIVFQRKSK